MRIGKKDWNVLAYGALASFGAYFCMYAFRKPFTVATFENLVYFGIDYKILLILAQVIGYMTAKFLGIKVISEMKKNLRLPYLLAMIGLAELSLIGFGLAPAPYNIGFLFMNGLSLGMVWGIVFSYLEGRKFTEFLGMALCSSFIVSSGAVKSAGLIIMDFFDISEFWMPAVTGAFFLLPFLGFAWLLEKIPPPSAEDIALRSERGPMTYKDRKALVIRFFWPLLILILFYTTLTALRDFRDNFAREIWDATAYAGNAAVFTLSELPIAIMVLLLIGATGFIKQNSKAFLAYHYMLFLGALAMVAATLSYQAGLIGPITWMVGGGFGLYACFVPFNCVFFDRMIATFEIKGNSGFLIYLADAFGYLGSMAILLYKNFGQQEVSWLAFFSYATYIIAALGMVAIVYSWLYFKNAKKPEFQNDLKLQEL
jgi:MFS family permease